MPKNTTWGGASYPEEPGGPPEAAAVAVEPEAVSAAAEVVSEPAPEPAPKPAPSLSRAKDAPADITGEGGVIVPKPEAADGD